MSTALLAEPVSKDVFRENARVVGLVSAVVLLIFICLNFFFEQRHLRAEEKAKAGLFALSIAESVKKNSKSDVEALILASGRSIDALSITVFDKDAQPFVAWSNQNQFRSAEKMPSTELIDEVKSDLQLAQLNIAVPLVRGDEMIGKLQVSVGLKHLYMHTILAALLGFLIVVLFTLLCAYKLTELYTARMLPIRHLSETAEQVATLGDYSLRVAPQKGREFDDLIYSFNDILGRIESWEFDRQSEARERQEAERRLAILANHDTLTKLPNRKYFQSLMQDALTEAVQSKQLAALMFIDLNQFKAMNESFGYDGGDLILATISNRIHAVLRNTDTLCRVDGDEFGAILPNVDSKEMAMQLAERLLHEISQPMALRGKRILITASIGIACCPLHGSELRQILKCADTALKEAQAAGQGLSKGQFRLFKS